MLPCSDYPTAGAIVKLLHHSGTAHFLACLDRMSTSRLWAEGAGVIGLGSPPWNVMVLVSRMST